MLMAYLVTNQIVMKYSLTLLLILIISIAATADIRALESVEVKSDLVGINFEDNERTLVLTFSDNIDKKMHSIIEIERINSLEYKTRVMRYFGGLLVNDTYAFKNLVVEIDGKRMKYDWSRANVSIIVNKMCQQAEMLI